MANEIKTQLRLPTELHGTIKQLADADLRSLNAEIVILLREAVGARGANEGTTMRREGRNIPAHIPAKKEDADAS